MVSPTLDTPPVLSPESRDFLAAALDPSSNPDQSDPAALAAWLDSPGVADAIDAGLRFRQLRIKVKLAAATELAVDRLVSILQTAEEPTQLRLAANSITRLAYAQRTRPAGEGPLNLERTRGAANGSSDLERTRRASEGSSRPATDHPAPDATLNGDSEPPTRRRYTAADIPPGYPFSPPSYEEEPDPYNPDTPPTEAYQLPFPTKAATPADVVRAQVLVLKHAGPDDTIRRLLYHSTTLPIRMGFEQDRFDAGLLASPAWTHRHLPFTIHDPVFTDHTATVRVTYAHPPPTGDPAAPINSDSPLTSSPPHLLTCSAIFHLIRSDKTTPYADQGSIWVASAVTCDTG